IAALGVLSAIVLPVVVSIVSIALGYGLGVNAVAFTAFLGPTSLAYSIVKHDLFEIDALVKRGAYYLVLTSIVATIYVGVVFLLQLTVGGVEFLRSPTWAALFALGVLVLLNPLRHRLQGVLDRVFFRTTYDG